MLYRYFGRINCIGYSLDKSIKYAIVGSAISVTRYGAQESMPEFEEIIKDYRIDFPLILSIESILFSFINLNKPLFMLYA
ncbi:MAG: hypothetical protein Ct9H90mP2_13270 [Dehalococcoidia bacterium]|nr:MAG: hypothetical protein Ct9H90mP2_13270 [Dehalococcoidia bacterium]